MKDDVIDPRDLAKELQDLEGERATLEEEVKQGEETLAFCTLGGEETELAETSLRAAKVRLQEWDDDNSARLVRIREVLEEIGDEAMIKESYWVEYCEEMVKDIGDLPSKIPTYIEIDWEATAENIQQDYSSIEYDGNTYYYRNC